jgi:outer membrane receptor protein involved in Fe transport
LQAVLVDPVIARHEAPQGEEIDALVGAVDAGIDAGGVDPRGPVAGYVATRSVTATKTNTPLIETPQAITVIGREQIEAQGAQTLTPPVAPAPRPLPSTDSSSNRAVACCAAAARVRAINEAPVSAIVRRARTPT